MAETEAQKRVRDRLTERVIRETKTKRKAPPRSAAGARMRRRAKRRENAFRELQSTVNEILRVAPAVDEALIKRLRALERRLAPRAVKPPKRERGA